MEINKIVDPTWRGDKEIQQYPKEIQKYKEKQRYYELYHALNLDEMCDEWIKTKKNCNLNFDNNSYTDESKEEESKQEESKEEDSIKQLCQLLKEKAEEDHQQDTMIDIIKYKNEFIQNEIQDIDKFVGDVHNIKKTINIHNHIQNVHCKKSITQKSAIKSSKKKPLKYKKSNKNKSSSQMFVNNVLLTKIRKNQPLKYQHLQNWRGDEDELQIINHAKVLAQHGLSSKILAYQQFHPPSYLFDNGICSKKQCSAWSRKCVKIFKQTVYKNRHRLRVDIDQVSLFKQMIRHAMIKTGAISKDSQFLPLIISQIIDNLFGSKQDIFIKFHKRLAREAKEQGCTFNKLYIAIAFDWC